MKHNRLFLSWAAVPFFCIIFFCLRACFYLLLMHLHCSFLLSFLGTGAAWGSGGNRQISVRHFSGVCKPMQVRKLASVICHGPCSNSDESLPWKCLCLFTPCSQLNLCPQLSEGWKQTLQQLYCNFAAVTKCFKITVFLFLFFLEVP